MENTMSKSRESISLPQPARILLAASAAFLALALGGALQPASAVECANVGTGGDTAADNGLAGNTACGDNAAATGTDSTAIGPNTNANLGASVAIGQGSQAESNGIALGNDGPDDGDLGAVAGGPNSVAIGTDTLAQSVNATAIGTNANAGGPDSIAIGTDNLAQSDDSIAIGTSSLSGSPGTTAVGRNTNAQAPGATAIGDGARAIGVGSSAIGSNAVTGEEGSVAIGAGSVANRAEEISVGSAGNERQIANVAPGTLGTDAANVDQLAVALDAIEDLKAEIEALKEHTHTYLTGRGQGHNNTEAETGDPLLPVEQPDDMDGAESADDLCPGTPEGVEVDPSGCGMEGFCAMQGSGLPWQEAKEECKAADWFDDESGKSKDCRWRQGACEAR
jgi:hypothetical protein